MYLYSPDEIDRERAHHQAVIQGADDVDVKRIGNLGELAFEQFCREYLPVEMWNWKNEEAIRRCNPESFAGHDFEVFDYTVDVKTSRDVSAFQPGKLLENDPDDDILVMVWHRDNEDALIMLGWERTETLQSKVRTQSEYSGEEPEKLAHLATRPMNELHDLGPNTAHLNQKPENPFQPGDRVVKAADEDASVGVVVEVLPPEEHATLFGQEVEGEAVRVAFPETLDEGPGDWREIHPAKLASYCVDQDIQLYDYKHTSLEFADQPFTIGDYVIKPDYDDPDLAIVTSVDGDEITVVFEHLIEKDYLQPQRLEHVCENHDINQYSFDAAEMAFEPQY
ncbi:hypothetical protein PNP59_03080 [Halobacterium salinarum]|uniref:hypothetical protein n=1 Tax=Halobacterium salinarum TaxID=2242 RepID=UPI0025555BB2|nr:hypothetical protein [Halobacterium salinarum]MDL0129921.1 hypothetical protein [Halobacterium salinarum]MDL0135045.1 hypothetical protein [Halobacterium salinarum]MDL0145206.1 hypothetical protein [Halobacterium salinarum]